MDNSLLSLSNISKTYRTVRYRTDQNVHVTPGTVVDDLSIAIHRGELFGLLGPSGCGKTTTLRLILGLERVDQGRISFKENDITAVPAEQRGFGMVFQNYALFTELDAFENIAYGLRVRNKPYSEIRRHVEGLLSLLRLPPEIQTRRPHELSGGEQQRVAIARALATEPEVLLLDEPFANLDAGLRRYTGEEIRRIVKLLNIATVFVTHDQNEVFCLCDRMAVMRSGKVLQIGAPESIYERPAQPWVAQFLGFQLLAARRVPSGPHTVEFAIEEGGWKVSAREPCNGSKTDRAIIAIRPEDVGIVPGCPISDTLLPATVLNVSFGGSTSRVTLAIGTTTIEALVLRGCEPLPGDRCGIRMSPDDLLVYPHS